jgi:hypothetical protein
VARRGRRDRTLPADAAAPDRHRLLDTLAAMASGAQLLPGKAAPRHIRANGGEGVRDGRRHGHKRLHQDRRSQDRHDVFEKGNFGDTFP